MSAKFSRALIGALSLIVAASGHASPADNKATAINAMTDLFSKQDPSAVDRYFGGTPYTQHNMRVPNGIDALHMLGKMATTWKGVHTEIIRAVADGDMVVLQSAYYNLANSQQSAVAFDLFKFNAEGKIIEHWDALEGFPGPSPAGKVAYEGTTQITDLDKTEANRKTVKHYLETVAIEGKVDKKPNFLATDYVDHGLTEATLQSLNKNDPSLPPTSPMSDMRPPPTILTGLTYVKMHKVLAEGDFVFVQGEGKSSDNDLVEIYNLFRVKQGKLVEHWDVIQPVLPRDKWQNSNGPF